MTEMGSELVIRPARPQDLPAIGDLWEELMDHHVRLDARYERGKDAREVFLYHLKHSTLRSPDDVLFVAEMEGSLAGFLIARVEYGGAIFAQPDYGYITDTCVAPAYRRMGVGRQLFDRARTWFKAQGLPNIRVSVSIENDAAMAFWRDVGFRPFMERLWYDLGDEPGKGDNRRG